MLNFQSICTEMPTAVSGRTGKASSAQRAATKVVIIIKNHFFLRCSPGRRLPPMSTRASSLWP